MSSQFGLLAPYAISKQETAKQALKTSRDNTLFLPIVVVNIVIIWEYLLCINISGNFIYSILFNLTILRSIIGPILLMRGKKRTDFSEVSN